MSIKVILTEEEILARPNYYELGEFAKQKYWQARRDQEGPQFDDEHFRMSVDESGLVTSINRPDEYDTCIMCGIQTPYLVSTHIDLRKCYVEGAGQICPNCYNK